MFSYHCILVLVGIILNHCWGSTVPPQFLSTNTLPSVEYEGLYDLYNSTNGPHWTWKQPYTTYGYPWKFVIPSENPCSTTNPWQGLTCSTSCLSKPCYILSIDLSNVTLVGSLPNSIGGFSSLTYLKLPNNYLTSTIPNSIGNLTALTHLDLSTNKLNGYLPSSMQHVIKLQELNLHFNNFTGGIPNWMGSFPDLVTLNLESNELRGTIPPSLGLLKKLEVLVLADIKLTGTIPHTLGYLNNIIKYELDRNHLIGTIPDLLILNKSTLEVISLYNNFMTGSIPDVFISSMPLNTLFLSLNRLTGTIPLSLSNISTLANLDISRNQLTGSISPQLVSLPMLLQLYVNDNELAGYLPIGNNINFLMIELELQNNFLTGTIPSLWSKDYPYLLSLNIEKCLLTGTIPIEFEQFSRMEQLLLASNMLTGTIPSILSNVKTLQMLDLQNNQFHGTLSSLFSELINLKMLDISENNIIGTIPLSFGNLTNIIYFDLNDNHLNGTIPFTLSNFKYINFLSLSKNHLTGSIPYSLCLLNQTIIDLLLFTNRLTGTIPSCLSNFNRMIMLSLQVNCLTGTIPSLFGYFQSLEQLGLDSNHLSGTIPESLTNIKTIKAFYLQMNHFTGIIPDFNTNKIEQLILGYNELTGSIPLTISQLTKLTQIVLYANQLTGTLPNEWGGLPQLEQLYVNSNYFTGTIPAFALRSNIGILYLYNNYFYGKWFESNPRLWHLQAIDVSNNMISGTIDSEWFANMTLLQSVTLTENPLSGPIPSSLFVNKRLSSVVLASNCFSSTLPDTICYAKGISQLVLDGLHASPTCITRTFPFLPNSGIIAHNRVSGTIPSCIFQLLNLTMLHLGGNAFTGLIPNMPLPDSLSQLILSGNELTGVVPPHIWNSQVTYLDLSLNRLQGTLPSNMLPASSFVTSGGQNVNITVKLNINKLSGTVPRKLVHLLPNNVNILDGNLFSCNMERSDIPYHDPKYSSYNCGSDSTNYTLLSFGCVICFLLFMGGLMIKKSVEMFLQLYYYPRVDSRLELFLNRWKSLALLITIPCITIGMVLYGTISNKYSSYHNSFVWEVSAIYNIGVIPTILMFLWLIILLGFFIHYLEFAYTSQEGVTKIVSENDNPEPAMRFDSTNHSIIVLQRYLSSFTSKNTECAELAMILVNIIVVITINAAYVSAVKSDITAKQLIIVAFTVALFKIGMNYVLRKVGTKFGSRVVIGMNLFNHLIAPFIAEVFVSSDCFLYALSEAPSLSFSYKVYTCLVIDIPFISDVPCNFQDIMSTGIGIPTKFSISPPFHYSHQCSFSLISSYSYVFIFRYILTGLIAPCMIYLFTHIATPSITHADSSHRLNSRISPLRKRWWILWRQATNKLLPSFWRRFDSNDLKSVEKYLKTIEKVVRKSIRVKIGALVVTDVAMLLCFGAMFPPLTIVVCCSLFKDVIDIRMSINRLHRLEEKIQNHLESTIVESKLVIPSNSISNRDSPNTNNDSKEEIEQLSWTLLQQRIVNVKQRMYDEILCAESDIVKGLRYALMITCVIWAFVLFDTSSASSVGMLGSLWVVVILPLIPIILRKSHPYWSFSVYNISKMENQKGKTIEMEIMKHENNMSDIVNPMSRA